MRVRMKSIVAGPAGNYRPDDIADVEDGTAEAWIASGYAEEAPVAGAAAEPEPGAAEEPSAERQETEVATLPEAQTATPRTSRRRKSPAKSGKGKK